MQFDHRVTVRGFAGSCKHFRLRNIRVLLIDLSFIFSLSTKSYKILRMSQYFLRYRRNKRLDFRIRYNVYDAVHNLIIFIITSFSITFYSSLFVMVTIV